VTIQPSPPIQAQPSSISLYCPTQPVDAHIQTINISGAITPERDNAPVTVTYTQPDGTTIVDHTTTVPGEYPGDPSAGSYSDSITPEEPGTWHLQASWPGDATYANALSPICTVEVDPEPPR
jgi:hypothetical protein